MERASRPTVGSYDEELAEIAAMVREHLAWEELMGGSVLPRVDPTSLVTTSPAPDSSSAPEPSPSAAAVRPAPSPAPTQVGATPAAGPVPAARPVPPVAPAPEGAPVAAPPPARPAPTPSAPTPSAPTAAPAPSAQTPEGRRRALEVLAAETASCTRCRLHSTRTRSVFARGTGSGGIAFVGEGPGYHEDQQGYPFVGAAGQLLDRMIAAMGFERDEVYVCNVVKCRPPENRTPLPDEAGACEPFLTRQLELVAPKVIVALGRCAAENLGCAEPGRSWRGTWGTWRGIPVMPTYHPAFLLRSPEMKRPVWEDLQKVVHRMGRTLPPPGSRKG